MVKRAAEDIQDGNEAYLKRQKITNSTSSGANTTTTEEIRHGRQLRQLLAFDQDLGRAKSGQFGLCPLKCIVLTFHRYSIFQGLSRRIFNPRYGPQPPHRNSQRVPRLANSRRRGRQRSYISLRHYTILELCFPIEQRWTTISSTGSSCSAPSNNIEHSRAVTTWIETRSDSTTEETIGFDGQRTEVKQNQRVSHISGVEIAEGGDNIRRGNSIEAGFSC